MTAEKIKLAALHLFARNGYEGTSVSDIAQLVGIKKPSLYNHFKSKEDIFLSVYEEVLMEQVEHAQRVLETLPDASVEEKLFHFLKEYCGYYLRYEDKLTLLKRVMLFPPEFLKDALQEKFLKIDEAFARVVIPVIEQGMQIGVIRQAQAHDLLMAYFCLIDGLFTQMFYYGSKEHDERLENAWKIFWAGICAGSV